MNNVYTKLRPLQELVFYSLMRLMRSEKNKTKIFCVGRNKTGTTSLASFFRTNGYQIGDQEQAELLLGDWAKRDFTRIIEYCKTAEVFQDIPFSLPDTYKALDLAYPDSKFILTVRSTSEEWYRSLVAHHSRRMSSTDGLPSEDDLSRFIYRKKYKGFILFMQKVIYDYPSVPLYDRRAYIAHYEDYNNQVMDYFKQRTKDFLLVNLSDENAFEKLCSFIGLDPVKTRPLPHLNKSVIKKKDLKRFG